MMIKSVVFISTIVLVSSAPVDKPQARILEYEFQPNTGDGSYKFKYETSNGISREETGVVKLDKDNKEYIAVKGYYSYDSEKGKITVHYSADENGYKEGEINLLEPNLELPLEIAPGTTPPPLFFPAAALGSLVGGGLG